MKVYEHSIDILLSPTFEDAKNRDNEVKQRLRPVRERCFTPTKGAPAGTKTQERALVRLLWNRASERYKSARENGYVGSFHNCVFELLFGIFGMDIIAYLFNQGWVPETTVNPFRPLPFLKRLSVPEEAARKLKDHAKTPVTLPETAPYLVPGMGPDLECFREKQHRLLLECSLRELRGFGELALSRRRQEQTVFIQIYDPYGFDDPECQAFQMDPKGGDDY
jgi:hypothetical protein